MYMSEPSVTLKSRIYAEQTSQDAGVAMAGHSQVKSGRLQCLIGSGSMLT